MVKLLDCNLEESEVELQSRHWSYFLTNTIRKGMNFLISPTMDYPVLLLFFNNDGFSIK